MYSWADFPSAAASASANSFDRRANAAAASQAAASSSNAPFELGEDSDPGVFVATDEDAGLA